MIPLQVACPKCGEGLMDSTLKLDGHPSIALWVRTRGGEGPLHLSALFGSFRYETQVQVEPCEAVEMYCPKCRLSLGTPEPCSVCGAAMAHLKLDVGGEVYFCTRKGCKNHKVELVDLEASLDVLYQTDGKSRQ